MDHKLTTPFTDVFGVRREMLTLKDVVTGGDVLAARKAGGNDSLAVQFQLVARLAGIDIRDVEAMDIRDVNALCVIVDQVSGYADPKADATP